MVTARLPEEPTVYVVPEPNDSKSLISQRPHILKVKEHIQVNTSTTDVPAEYPEGTLSDSDPLWLAPWLFSTDKRGYLEMAIELVDWAATEALFV